MAFSLRNQFRVAATSAELTHFRQQAWQLYTPIAPTTMAAFGREWQLRPGLTFTPFANAVRCTAHCAFCSEELQRYDGHQLTAKRLIDDYPAYFDRLREVLRPFRGWPLGLSLSGLEATAEPQWLRELLACLTQLKREGVCSTRKCFTPTAAASWPAPTWAWPWRTSASNGWSSRAATTTKR